MVAHGFTVAHGSPRSQAPAWECLPGGSASSKQYPRYPCTSRTSRSQAPAWECQSGGSASSKYQRHCSDPEAEPPVRGSQAGAWEREDALLKNCINGESTTHSY
jgi:hypothetical protein